jgi:NAD+ diphosphatase
MDMNYCYKCGTRLVEKDIPREGKVPFCPTCNEPWFPIFSTAVSMEVLSPDRQKVLLIQQYGKKRNVLVAGYVSKGEYAEQTVAREVMEEIGLAVHDIRYQQSRYYAPSNTLMLNFSCVAACEDLSGVTDEVDKAQWVALSEAREAIAHGSLAEAFLVGFLEHRDSEAR